MRSRKGVWLVFLNNEDRQGKKTDQGEIKVKGIEGENGSGIRWSSIYGRSCHWATE